MSESRDGKLTADDALSYALDRSFLALFGVLLVGWALTSGGLWLSTAPTYAYPRGFRVLVGPAMALVGALVQFVGVVALLHKVFADAVRTGA